MLEGIKQVDAPPFLWTRIQQKVEHASRSRFSLKVTFALVAIAIVVIMINALLVTDNIKKNAIDSNLAQAMDLLPHNSLY